jgi:addiction module HigA family antidote
MKNPPHPGDLIRTEVIEALGLTVSKAAEILQVRRATLSDLLHGKAALTPEMALRIEKAFGPEMAPSPHAARLRRGEGTSAGTWAGDQAVRSCLKPPPLLPQARGLPNSPQNKTPQTHSSRGTYVDQPSPKCCSIRRLS